MLKTCSVCREPKPLDQTHFRRKTKRQYTGTLTAYWDPACKNCRNTQSAAYRKLHPAKPPTVLQQQARRERSRRYRRLHVESVAVSQRRYRRTITYRLLRKMYKQRRRNAPGKLTATKLLARIAFYSNLCWFCKKPATEIDHVIPITRGGSNWPSNLRPACRSCNSRKYNRLLTPLPL